MIAFITICYAAIVWVLAIKLRVLPWNGRTRVAAGGIYVVFILALVIAMNLYQPYSTDLRVYGSVAALVPRVSGRIVEITATPNRPLRKGDVIYRIDPREYEYAVARLEAGLRQAEAEFDLAKLEFERTKSAARTAAVSQSEVDTWEARAASAQATIGETQALLDKARLDLVETVVYAPADGMIPNLSLSEGQIAGATARASLVPFLDTKSIALIASFRQSSMPYIERGDPAEIAFDQHPGRVFAARVVDLITATGQGQLEPSATLQEWSEPPAPGNFGVRLELVDAGPDIDLTVGASGAAGIYTQRGASIRIVRKVVIRIYSWLNYL